MQMEILAITIGALAAGASLISGIAAYLSQRVRDSGKEITFTDSKGHKIRVSSESSKEEIEEAAKAIEKEIRDLDS